MPYFAVDMKSVKKYVCKTCSGLVTKIWAKLTSFLPGIELPKRDAQLAGYLMSLPPPPEFPDPNPEIRIKLILSHDFLNFDTSSSFMKYFGMFKLCSDYG